MVRAGEVADQYQIDRKAFFNMITSESQWDPSARSKTGDVGLVQINLASHPTITENQAIDVEFSLEWAAARFAEGKEWQLWTVCSCIQYARALGVDLPRVSATELEPNTTLSELKENDLVLFKYSNGQRHVGVFWGYKDGKLHVRQSNFEPCKAEAWLLDPADPSILGFWAPTSY